MGTPRLSGRDAGGSASALLGRDDGLSVICPEIDNASLPSVECTILPTTHCTPTHATNEVRRWCFLLVLTLTTCSQTISKFL